MSKILERIQEEVEAQFKILSRYLSEGTDENHKNLRKNTCFPF
jgi:hypothetical protein